MFMWHVGDIAEKKKCKTGQHEKMAILTHLAEASLIRLEKIDTKVYYSVNKEMLQKCFGFYQKKLLHP